MNEPLMTTVALAAGALLAVVVVLLSRRQALSMRYTLGWLFVALCVAVGGALIGVVGPIAGALDVPSGAVVLAFVLAGLLAVTVQLSITVSGLSEIVRTLTESHALLEQRVRRVESVGVEVQELERVGDELVGRDAVGEAAHDQVER